MEIMHESIYIPPEQEYDAIFLPSAFRNGKKPVHGCDDEIYIIYCFYRDDSDKRSFEIEVLERDTLLEIIKFSDGNHKIFFENLPDYFNGKWFYLDESDPGFNELYSLYNDADFIVSRDGTTEDEFNFICSWANGIQQ